jgi:hypothetical protein
VSGDGYDARFCLPAVDEDPATETGVILLGLETDRLLAGLGAAGPGDDDPAVVTLVVDQLRHGARPGLSEALSEGARRWRAARPALAAADPDGPAQLAALRPMWTYAARVVDAAQLGTLGAAARAYLAACWLRRTEVDRRLEDRHVVPDLTA